MSILYHFSSFLAIAGLGTLRIQDQIIRYLSQNTNSKKAYEIRLGIIHELMEHIGQFAESNRLNFDCISFESLGSEDFALLLLANDVNTFLQVLSIVRRQYVKFDDKDGDDNTKDIFKSICTLTGFNIYKYNGNPGLPVLVKLNVKKADYKEEILSEFSKHPEYGLEDDTCVLFQSKGTLVMRLNPSDLSLWHDEGVLNGTSGLYRKCIASSRTYWIEDKITNDDNECECNDIFKNFEFLQITISGLTTEKFDYIEDELIEIRKEENQYVTPKNRVGSFILSEYNRLLCLTRCTEWIEILHEQREAFMNCISFFEKPDENDEDKSLYQDQLNSMLEEIQTVLTHINQACAPISEIPYHNHYYSGSFSDILKMYYGIISDIINIGYKIPRINSQSKLTFGVKFETTNRIYTTIYSLPNHGSRIAIFHLPYKALYDFKRNIILLIHEVFHYIAPIDRKFRNNCVLKIWTSFICDELETYIYDLSNGDKELFKLVESILIKKQKEICDACCESINKSLLKIPDIELSDFINYDDGFTKLVFYHVKANIRYVMEAYLKNKLQNKHLDSKLRCKLIELQKICKTVFSKSEVSGNSNFEDRFTIKCGGTIRMGAQAKALKEAFCDLYMCKILDLDFEEYLKLFSWVGDSAITNSEKDLAVAYRINLIGYIINDVYPNWAEIDLEKLSENDEHKKSFYQKVKNSSLQLRREEALIWNPLLDALSREREFWEKISEYDSQGKIDGMLDMILELREGCYYKSDTFDSHMRTIHQFSGKPLPTNSSLSNNDVTYSKNFRYSRNLSHDDLHFVDSVSTYIETICNMNVDEGDSKNDWWYRGVCNDTFPLLPSLFRNLDDSLSLYANQVNILKEAYSSTLQFPELWRGTIAEHMCCLQHYGMPTNLLDFSLDMLISLHFAVNPDVESDQIAVTNGDWIPVVIIFKPNEYNRAVKALEEGNANYGSNTYKNISPILYDIAQDDLIGYFPQKTDAHVLAEHTRVYNEGYMPSRRADKYPIPVIVRRSNSRILSQNGTFLAFNLDSRPIANAKGQVRYQYLDLYQMQKDYTDLLLGANMQERRFIEVIRIAPHSVGAIRNDLKTLGISRAKMYPELKNIFDEGRSRYRGRIGMM